MVRAEVAWRWVRRKNSFFSYSFNGALEVDFPGSWVTSDGGLVLVRELDERLGFGELIARHWPTHAARTPSCL